MSKPTENRNAADVAAISLGSRFLTFIGRTMYIARFGAANLLLNAFAFALRVPEVISQVLWSAFTLVMIPVYNSLLAQDKPDEAKKFIDNIISISFVLLVVLAALGMVGAPWLSALLAGGDFENPEYLTFVLRVLMPMVIFFGFGAIFQGLLQSHGVFRLPAFVAAPGGIIVILYIVFFSERFGVTGLVFATALGFILQPLILIPAVRRIGYRYKFSFDLRDKNIRAAGRLCVPVLISVASYQGHFIFGLSIALRLGTTAIMDYAQQIVLVFILAIVYAIAAVYFPKLSVLWAKADAKNYNESLRNAMLYMFFLVLPAGLGFFILRLEIMDFLLNWRGGAESDIYLAGNLMGIYAIAVIAISFKEIADRAFYSKKDSKTPAIFGVVIMVVNIAATLALLGTFGAYAMPVAYGIAAVAGGGGLLFVLNKKTRFVSAKFFLEIAKTILAAVLMVGAAVFAQNFLATSITVLNLLIVAAVGAGVYFLAAYALGISALGALRGGFK